MPTGRCASFALDWRRERSRWISVGVVVVADMCSERGTERVLESAGRERERGRRHESGRAEMVGSSRRGSGVRAVIACSEVRRSWRLWQKIS